MNDMEPIHLPLHSLLIRLEQAGFDISLDTRLRLQKALQTFGTEYLHQPAQMKLVLAPLIAKNQEEQERFEEVFDMYYADILQKVQAITASKVSALPTQASTNAKGRNWANMITTWGASILVLILIFYVFNRISYYANKKEDISSETYTTHETEPTATELLEYSEEYKLNQLAQLDIHHEAMSQSGEIVKFYNDTPDLEEWEFIWNFGQCSSCASPNNNSVVEQFYGLKGNYKVKVKATHKPSGASKFITSWVYIDYDGSPVVDIIGKETPTEYVVTISNETPNQESIGVLSSQARGFELYAGAEKVFSLSKENTRLDFTAFRLNAPLAPALQVVKDFTPQVIDFENKKRREAARREQEAQKNELIQAQTQSKTEHQLHKEASQSLPLSEPKVYFTAWFYVLLGFISLVFWLTLEATLYIFSQRIIRKRHQADLLKSISDLSDFSASKNSIQADTALFTVANSLKQRKESNQRDLDIQATLKATIQAAGFPQLVYKSKNQAAEYLVLIDSKGIASQAVKLFEQLIDLLIVEQVPIEKLYWGQDNAWVRSAQSKKNLRLEELRLQYPNHSLLIYSNGQRFWNPDQKKLSDWFNKFVNHWEEKILLTSRPVELWDKKEQVLSELLLLMPADFQGQSMLVDALASPEPMDFWKLKRELSPQKLAEEKANTKIPVFLAEDSQSVDMPVLENYLGMPHQSSQRYLKERSPLFVWVCALAVYPRINWELTLAIGKKLEEVLGVDDLVNSSNLLKITSLPWLQGASIPADIETQLLRELKALPTFIEQAAREAALETLQNLQTKVRSDSESFKKLYIDIQIQKALLNQEDKQAWRSIKNLADLRLIDNQALKRALGRRYTWPWVFPSLRAAFFLLVLIGITRLEPQKEWELQPFLSFLNLVKIEEPEVIVDESQEFREIISVEEARNITSLDPAYAENHAANTKIVDKIYEGLFAPDSIQLGNTLSVHPVLAESWEIAANTLTYTIKIKKGVYFHDHPSFHQGKGREVKAQDFVYSFRRLLDPKLASPIRERLFKLLAKNNAGLVSDNSLEALDDYTLVIRLGTLNAKSNFDIGIDRFLANPHLKVIPREVVEWYKNDFDYPAVGTGPYKLDFWEHDRNRRFVLLANPNYWQALPDGLKVQPQKEITPLEKKKEYTSPAPSFDWLASPWVTLVFGLGTSAFVFFFLVMVAPAIRPEAFSTGRDWKAFFLQIGLDRALNWAFIGFVATWLGTWISQSVWNAVESDLIDPVWGGWIVVGPVLLVLSALILADDAHPFAKMGFPRLVYRLVLMVLSFFGLGILLVLVSIPLAFIVSGVINIFNHKEAALIVNYLVIPSVAMFYYTAVSGILGFALSLSSYTNANDLGLKAGFRAGFWVLCLPFILFYSIIYGLGMDGLVNKMIGEFTQVNPAILPGFLISLVVGAWAFVYVITIQRMDKHYLEVSRTDGLFPGLRLSLSREFTEKNQLSVSDMHKHPDIHLVMSWEKALKHQHFSIICSAVQPNAKITVNHPLKINGDLVMDASDLRDGDMIEIGNTKIRYVNLKEAAYHY